MAKTKDNKALAFMKSEGMSKFKEQFAEYFFLKDLGDYPSKTVECN
ncbi:hypothetical protein Q5H93_05795 [Hymenobacter sp. ASUV-10]|uniref:Uncharacterized protein n=1 Tax=Hymenobacter aranciens TaxID=3063996 RepID=A0ABT9B999_9BACT|nr:hypothetical protein [Hymenobacter sp. ASUV-10]MDO7874238.1 hypothetical protein [Hymenobacter sp. ASUV-10]